MYTVVVVKPTTHGEGEGAYSACGRFSSRHRDGILVQSTPLPEPPLVAKLPTGSPQVRQQEWGLARQGGKPFTEPPSARVHHNVRIHTHM